MVRPASFQVQKSLAPSEGRAGLINPAGQDRRSLHDTLEQKMSKIPQNEWSAIAKRHSQGETLISIARSYGCTAPAIHSFLKRNAPGTTMATTRSSMPTTAPGVRLLSHQGRDAKAEHPFRPTVHTREIEQRPITAAGRPRWHWARGRLDGNLRPRTSSEYRGRDRNVSGGI